MSVCTCFHEENGERCERDSVCVDEFDNEWCAEHIPDGVKLLHDFRDDTAAKGGE